MLAQRDLTPERLADRLAALTRDALLAMAIAARKLARPDAAERVANVCIALGERRP
jgi:UDP-N-acetylglucosamine--N-acetylmuramyl-(pentapeptide) pyrophosphoryl-undecaprenol N-acetylglucosamine transferase